MKFNEGVIDRRLRVAVGLLLIGLATTETVGVWGSGLELPQQQGGAAPALTFVNRATRVPF